MNAQPTTIRLPNGLVRDLDEIARAKGLTRSELIRSVLVTEAQRQRQAMCLSPRERVA